VFHGRERDLVGFISGADLIYLDEETAWTLSNKIGSKTEVQRHETKVKILARSLSTPNGDLVFNLHFCKIITCTSQDAIVVLRYLASRSPRVSLNESILLASSCPLPLIRGIRTPDILLDLSLDS
jgi:hypothetical protein